MKKSKQSRFIHPNRPHLSIHHIHPSIHPSTHPSTTPLLEYTPTHPPTHPPSHLGLIHPPPIPVSQRQPSPPVSQSPLYFRARLSPQDPLGPSSLSSIISSPKKKQILKVKVFYKIFLGVMLKFNCRVTTSCYRRAVTI